SYTSMTGPFGGGIAVCCFLRSAMTSATHPVHVGSMSTIGTTSTTKVGSSSGWKPSSDQVAPAATRSRISSANAQPNGPRMSCNTSVVAATPYADQMRLFVNTGGAKRENVRSTTVPRCNLSTGQPGSGRVSDGITKKPFPTPGRSISVQFSRLRWSTNEESCPGPARHLSSERLARRGLADARRHRQHSLLGAHADQSRQRRPAAGRVDLRFARRLQGFGDAEQPGGRRRRAVRDDSDAEGD